MESCLKFVQKIWANTLTKGGQDHNVLSSLRIVAARPGYCKAILPIESKHLNNHRTIHGGVILGLTDTITSLALSTHGIPAPTGVSVNISTEFVRPGGREGDELCCVGEVIQRGKTLAYTKATFFTPEGKVVAYGSHTKYMGNNVPTTSFSACGQEEKPLPPSAKL